MGVFFFHSVFSVNHACFIAICYINVKSSFFCSHICVDVYFSNERDDYLDHTARYGKLLSRSCISCCTVLNFSGCYYRILFASHTSGLFLNLLFTIVCVWCPNLCVYSKACMGLRVPWASVMAYWSSPTEVVGPQVQSIKTMGNLSWERCISQEPSDWLLPRSRLPWWWTRS